jgi:hypothetical protein
MRSGKRRVIRMRKNIVIIVALVMVALIIITLFNNRAQMQQSARLNHAVVYSVSVTTATRQKYNQQISQAGLMSFPLNVRY